MIRIGLLGCGRIGQIHARNVVRTQGAKLVALFDPVADAAAALADETGAQSRTMTDVIHAPDTDAILVCTPTTTHYDIIHDCIAAKKAIFCEKPVDLSYERSQACVSAAEAADVPFMVAFNRRFDPNFSALKAKIDSGDIGDVEMVTILSRDPSPAPPEIMKTQGGIFRDMMIHDFDMARFLLGEDPVSVYATGSVLVDPQIGEIGDVDTAAVTMKTASGKLCQISNSRRATYGYDQRIEVHGSKGLLRAENILENSVEIATAEGFKRAPAQHFFLERYAAAYVSEIQAFVDALTHQTPLSPGGSDGLKAQELAEMATTSWKTGLAQQA